MRQKQRHYQLIHSRARRPYTPSLEVTALAGAVAEYARGTRTLDTLSIKYQFI